MTKLILLTTTMLFTFLNAADPDSRQEQGNKLLCEEVSANIVKLSQTLNTIAGTVLNNQTTEWRKLSKNAINTAIIEITGCKRNSF